MNEDLAEGKVYESYSPSISSLPHHTTASTPVYY